MLIPTNTLQNVENRTLRIIEFISNEEKVYENDEIS